MRIYRLLCCLPILFALSLAAAEQHLLYVASPGTRNYVEYGGVGILVFDIDNGYKFVRRIPTWSVPDGQQPENVKGIAASAKTGRVYVTSLNRIIAIDAVSGKKIWDKSYEGGCDRLAVSPDGKILYVPQLEGPLWHVVNSATGGLISSIETKSGSHNTIYSADGAHVYLAGLKSNLLSVADPKTHKIASTVGPFDNVIRPFTVNGSNTLVFVNINGLLGFEVGDLRTGKKLYHVEVEGYKQGPVKRHGCPSHGIALTPDERELWVADCANSAIHVFDSSVMPPKQTTSIKARDCVGWLSFSMDGRFAYSSTGEIIDVATKKIVAALRDEAGREVQSEKLLDVTIAGGKVVRAGNQFGVGMKSAADRHAGVNSRGDHAMGFSHEKTTHHFRLLKDGGAVEVSSNDPKDADSREQIRAHLKHIAASFSAGDFEMPMFIHDQVPPGVPVMKRLKSEIKYEVENIAGGARVRISSANPEAVKAVQDFLRFQITDHQTGDSLEP